jgi:hypothetical protein
MVRLVFRPYTQLRRSICTSESLRSSTRVSPGFNLARHSSPSFGSQRACSSCSPRNEVDGKRRACAPQGGSALSCQAAFAFTAPLGFRHPVTRTHVRLLGPCFKTGQRRRRPTRARDAGRSRKATPSKRPPSYPRRGQSQKNAGAPRPPKGGPKTSPTLLIRQTQRFGAYNAGEMQPRLQTNPNAEPLRVPYARAAREPQPEPPTPNFEERLRLPPYSFTYS